MLSVWEAVGYVAERTVRSLRRARSAYRSRVYRKGLHRLGSSVHFNGLSRLTGLGAIEIGDNVHVGDNAFIRGEGGLVIGANTHISRNLVLYTFNHEYEGQALPYDDTERHRPVTIGRNVWIGMNVVILPGAEIGEGAIIGAGTVVQGEVPERAIIGAVPGRVIDHRDTEHYRKLDDAGRYGGVSGEPLQY